MAIWLLVTDAVFAPVDVTPALRLNRAYDEILLDLAPLEALQMELFDAQSYL